MSGSVQIVLPPFPIFIPSVSCSLRGYFALFLKWLDTWRQVVTSHVQAKWWHKYFFDRKLCSSGQRNSDLALNIWLLYSREQKHVLLSRKSTLRGCYKLRHVTKRDMLVFEFQNSIKSRLATCPPHTV